MRKVIVSNLVSLDGFFEGPNDSLDWFTTDEEFFAYARETLNEVDTILFGRKTYEHMAAYWPLTTGDDPVITHKMNHLEKVVFSKTLASVSWKNSSLARQPLKEAVTALKEQPGKDMVIFGSSTIVNALLNLGLIDECRLIVNPTVLGSGTPHFSGIHGSIKMKLVKAVTHASGNVILYYEPLR